MPEHRRRTLPEHESYETLCALAAGGFLEGAELSDFQGHMKECSQCRAAYQEFSNLVACDLPQAQGSVRQRFAVMKAKPLPYSRQRFLRRARAEGVVFSREVDTPTASSLRYSPPLAALAPVVALLVVAAGFSLYHLRERSSSALSKGDSASQQIAELQRQNSALAETQSRLNNSLAEGKREVQDLRAQLATAAATAEDLRRSGEQAQGEAEKSSSRTAQLLDESRNQEKLLAEAKQEAANVNQLRVNDEASLVEQQVHIAELTDRLRIASATLDAERQLAAAGKDVRELMAARQLHVIDVRDTDPNGDPSKAFGRVFLAEGRSLTFYAFDLNEDRVANAKSTFQVWAASEGSNTSARSLGFLRVDAKAAGRWVLKVENAELVKDVSSVFVTAGPAAGSKQPSGQKMLYAYLGQANHP